MNIKLTLATALLLTATQAFAQSKVESSSKSKAKADAAASSDGKLTVVSTESVNGDDDKVHSIQLKVENGKITVKRNGKEVPADRIRTEDDGRVIILDENGDPIDNVRLFTGTGQDGGWITHDGENGLKFFEGEGLKGFQMLEGGEGRGFWTGDEEGPAPKVMIGVHMTEPGEALEKHLHLKPGKSAIITGVFQGLPAEVAGIGEHDIIVAIDGSDDADAGTIRKILSSKEPGDTCTVRVIQSGEPREIKIKLQAFDQQKLGSSTLIGKEPGDQMWTSTFGPMSDMTIDMKNLAELPNIKNRVFVSPKDISEWRGMTNLQGIEMDKLQPQIQKALQDALKNYEGAIKLHQGDLGGGDEGGGEVESKLDRLDKRMAQLEQMLEKLIEKQAKP